jgi:hypothetical protein
MFKENCNGLGVKEDKLTSAHHKLAWQMKGHEGSCLNPKCKNKWKNELVMNNLNYIMIAFMIASDHKRS